MVAFHHSVDLHSCSQIVHECHYSLLLVFSLQYLSYSPDFWHLSCHCLAGVAEGLMIVSLHDVNGSKWETLFLAIVNLRNREPLFWCWNFVHILYTFSHKNTIELTNSILSPRENQRGGTHMSLFLSVWNLKSTMTTTHFCICIIHSWHWVPEELDIDNGNGQSQKKKKQSCMWKFLGDFLREKRTKDKENF